MSALLVLGIVAIAGSALFSEHGIAHLLRLQGQKRELSRATFALLQGNDRLRQDIHRLRSDDLYLESLARRQLGLVRPNETVYRVRRPAS